MSWLTWIVIAIVGGFALLVTSYFAVVLLIARFKRRRVRQLISLPDELGPTQRSGFAARLAADAHAAGILHLGAFLDETTFLFKTRLDLLLSEDGQVLLLVPSLTRASGYRLATRMTDERWLITGELESDTDLSGLCDSAMLPKCPFALVLRYHRDRVERYSSPPIPFDPETLTQDIGDLDRRRGHQHVEAGLARWVTPEHDAYAMTWRGAGKQMWLLFVGFADLSRQKQNADAYKAAVSAKDD